jgi:outer membrane protein TolC
MLKIRIQLLTLILAFTQWTFAQEQLSLGDAVSISLERNFDIRLEQKNVLVAQNNNTWGEAGRYPTVNLNLGQNNSITDNIKTASPFQLQDQVVSNSLNPGMNVNWTLFNGFAVNINKRRFEQLQAESEGNASIVIANTIQAVILAYYRVVLEYDRLEELTENLELSKDQYEYKLISAELGGAVTQDLLLDEGNYLTDSINLMNQQLLARNALRDLNFLLGENDPDRSYIFTDPLVVAPEAYDFTELRQKMLDQNVDLKKQFITQSVLGSNVDLARSARYPALNLTAGISEARSTVNLSRASFPNGDGTSSPGPSEPLDAITDNYFANFTLSFTLFNGGKINRAIRNAVVQEDIGQLRLNRMQESLERDLRKSLDMYNIRRQIYEINVRREEVAQTNLELSREKYRNGSINSFDFRIVQNNYLSSVILRSQSQYNLIDAHVELMRLTGGLIEDYNN